jgi:hypothetical protein
MMMLSMVFTPDVAVKRYSESIGTECYSIGGRDCINEAIKKRGRLYKKKEQGVSSVWRYT